MFRRPSAFRLAYLIITTALLAVAIWFFLRHVSMINSLTTVK
jgi:hypothetical protein